MKYSLLAIAVALLVSCASKEELTKSGLSNSKFESVVDGKQTHLYTLQNKEGMEVCVTNFGGRIVSIMVPDKNGEYKDVVLGHDSIADYVNIDGNFGALIGRYGNRINKGHFVLNGINYDLPKNNYGHCLHGGPKGYFNRMWDAKQLNDSTLELSIVDVAGSNGFPGTLNVKVTYSINEKNALKIHYEADTDAPTVVNLTNHSYFNLSGDPSTTILNEVVNINADGYTPIDGTFMTDGTIADVTGTPFDFRIPKAVGKDINANNQQLKNGLGYDHNMVLNTNGDISKPAVVVYDPTSGIQLTMYTDEPGVQFYVGNFLDGKVKGKKGIAYPQRSAMCLESQHFPDSPNHDSYPSTVLNPGEKYQSNCIYEFGIKK